jgi:hypothetical protein
MWQPLTRVTLNPGYPKNYQAGWGYMMLTNFLPSGGNGSYTLYAKATDAEGHKVTLGSKTITCDNAHATNPFGAIDTPSQGGTASGSDFLVWGWVLTPMPRSIATNGSTINVWVDSVSIGHPNYNVYRSDIATLFPGYANSNGAIGYYYLDTTGYSNGIHTIQWTVSDSGGYSDGIGSRYFNILNIDSSDRAKALTDQNSRLTGENARILPHADRSLPLLVKKGYKADSNFDRVYPSRGGVIDIETMELEPVQIRFNGETGLNSSRLPIGSTLDREKGIFYWSPGPGFLGKYNLVFTDQEGKKQWRVNIHIKPLTFK